MRTGYKDKKDNGCCQKILSNNKRTRSVQEEDEILAKELNDLSFQERERVYEEVHGVAALQEETPEFMKACLDNLQKEIANLSRAKRRALEKAFFLKPALQTDRKFLIMFLRADCYDAKKAAQRMGKYFTHKLELFGEEKLAKEITLEDLNDDDMECVHRGSISTLKERDRSGRPIWFVAQMHYKYKHWKNHIRYTWYQVMTTVLNDEEAQIRGIVDVVYCVGMAGMESDFSQLMTEGGYMIQDLPYRLVGLHFCYNDARLKPAMSLIQLVCARSTRLRFRTHFGSNIEVQYALMTFGIPMMTLPVRPDGSLKPEMNRQYVQERIQVETAAKLARQQQQSLNAVIEYPNQNDVLLGRGRPFQDFHGNQILMKLVEQQRDYYHNVADRFEKTCITMNILKKIQQDYNGRFLTRLKNNQGWQVVTDEVAREKVSHTFRTKTNVSQKKSKTSMDQTSSTQGIGRGREEDDLVHPTTKKIRYDKNVQL